MLVEQGGKEIQLSILSVMKYVINVYLKTSTSAATQLRVSAWSFTSEGRNVQSQQKW